MPLAPLLAAARAVVTVNSTVAVDALALGVPSLVIGLPNNLSPFVTDGAMLGADGSRAIADALDRLVHDDGLRRDLVRRGAEIIGAVGRPRARRGGFCAGHPGADAAGPGAQPTQGCLVTRWIRLPEKHPGVTIALVGLLFGVAYGASLIWLAKPGGRVVYGDALHHYVQLRSAVFDHDLRFTNEYVRMYGLTASNDDPDIAVDHRYERRRVRQEPHARWTRDRVGAGLSRRQRRRLAG